MDKLSERVDQEIPLPDLPILRRGSISWKRKSPWRRHRLPQNLPMSWRGSISWKRKSPWRRRRLPQNLPMSRLDKLEKKVAVAAAPSSEIAGLTTRLNKLEKRAVVAGASSANPLPPAPKQSSLMARVDPSAPNELARSDNPGPLLRDYSVEDARDGIAVVDSRSGPQEVAPGDFIPGAGRVLRIEKRGDDWFVLTSRGVIGSGPAP